MENLHKRKNVEETEGKKNYKTDNGQVKQNAMLRIENVYFIHYSFH